MSNMLTFLGSCSSRSTNTAIMSWCHIYYITSVILYIYSGYVTASEYYVSAAFNGESCLYTELPCHDLSYYTAGYASYFTDDTIFYFLEGTHTLQGTLEIVGVSNITLQGLGHIEQGFHETVMQSTSVIRCSDNDRARIQINSSSDVVLRSLTITNCGVFYNNNYRQTNVSLLVVDTYNVTLEWVSVQNGSGFGLFLENVFDVLIAYSSFAQNQPFNTCFDCSGGNVYILHYTQSTNKTLYSVDIIQSNFTFGLNLKGCIRNKNQIIVPSSGGLSISLRQKQSYKIQIKIDSVVFYDNSGNIGANFRFLASNTGHYSLTMSNTISTYGKALKSSTHNYHCTFGAGMALLQSYISNDVPEVIIENCTFEHNYAQQYGGGVFISCECNIIFRNSNIFNNTAYHGSGMVLHTFRSSQYTFYFADVLFDSNKVPEMLDKLQAAVLLTNIQNVTFEQIEVSNHDITGLSSYNSHLTFEKDSKFVSNSGILGGGMALYDSSNLILKEQTNISFFNNYASESGGGIFVSEDIVAIDFPTYCFYKLEPDHNINATLYFVNNKAEISGDVLYGGNVDYCLDAHAFDNLFKYSQDTGSSSVVSSDPIQVCFCEPNGVNCSITNINISAMPGINVNVSLATVGSKEGLTKGVIKLTSSDSSSKAQIVNNRLNANCTDVTFSVTANTSLNTTQVYVTLEKSIKPLYDPFAKVIDITIQSCPIGFPLDIKNNTCVCRSELTKPPTINCDINTQIITRKGDLWIGYENDHDCLIVYKNCPFDYCSDNNISFTFNTSNEQCLHSRSGLLCGQCAKGFSLMLGSNHCGQCTNNHIALIIPFALAGIALIAFIIFLNLTVSVGTINGLIFYANVVKIYEHIFFPKGLIPFLSLFISWLNLDLGIETCFIDGMGSCSKTWLQFIFPGYVWFLLILIIILSRYSSKVVRLVGRQIIPVLATMILLSYTKLIRTVFQVLYRTNIPCNGEMLKLLRWYIDANVQYVRGCHIPLFLFSLAVLILLIVPYTFYLLTIPLLEGPLSKYMRYCQKLFTYMKPFFDAYGGPYKDNCRFWTGFLLLVRVVLALVVSLDSEAISLNVLTALTIVITSMYFILRGIYRQFPLACLELFFIYNLVFMAYMNTQTFNSKEQVPSIVLVSLAFVVFCGIILYHVRDRLIFYHVWDRLLKSRMQQPITKVKKIFKKSPSPDVNNDIKPPSMHPESPGTLDKSISVSMLSVEMKRESFLFEVND